jgi:hypothetical protein
VPAVSPYVPFYAEAQPYITVDEYLAAPTGVDVSQLIPGGNTSANRAALATRILSASAYADSLCYQVLGATTDMATGEFRVFRDGTIRVPLPFTPVIEVTNVALGWRAGALQNLSDLSGLWFQKKVVRIPVCGLSAALTYTGPVAPSRSGSLFAQVTYVNGYANTILAADVAAGASSIVVKGTLGIFAGMPLTISDDKNGTTETVTVGAGYVAGSTTVPLVAPVGSQHTAGVGVSALPRPIKEAVIALTSHLIKTRGAESLALSGVSGGPTHTEKDVPGSDEEYDLAADLLHPFRRVA